MTIDVCACISANLIIIISDILHNLLSVGYCKYRNLVINWLRCATSEIKHATMTTCY